MGRRGQKEIGWGRRDGWEGDGRVGRGERSGKWREGKGKGKSQRSVPANKNLRLHPWSPPSTKRARRYLTLLM